MREIALRGKLLETGVKPLLTLATSENQKSKEETLINFYLISLTLKFSEYST